jgi:hypothetical protein
VRRIRTLHTNMSIKKISQRLERLESRLLPDTGEPMVINVCFVSSDHRVVEERQFTLPAAPHPRGWRRRPRTA